MLNARVEDLTLGGRVGTPKVVGLPSHRLNAATVVIATLATLSIGGTTAYTLWQFQSSGASIAPKSAIAPPKITTVTSLGRLEPQGEAIALSAPASAEGSRLEKLLVKEGDRVKTGQEIAILDSRDRLSAAVEQSQERVKVAEANLAKVKAGAKRGEIAAQEAAIARIQAEQKNDILAQEAAIARIQAEQKNEIVAQEAAIARIQAEQKNDILAQEAAIARIQAERIGDINTQEATIARLKAELTNAQSEYQRYQMLYQNGASSAQTLDSKRLNLEAAQEKLIESQAALNRIISTKEEQVNEARANLDRTISTKEEQLKEAQANLNGIISTKEEQINEARANLNRTISGKTEQFNEATATLDRIVEVRPVDVLAAEAEVSEAKAAVKQARANLEQAYVRSPQDAQVLKIHTRPGELISSEGIVEVGETSQMFAVAEVYESDVIKVRVGQKVKVSSDSLTEELQGTVEQIGLQVKRQNVINTDPSANIDSRVVEVRVRLDANSSQKVTGLTNLQVKVEIAI